MPKNKNDKIIRIDMKMTEKKYHIERDPRTKKPIVVDENGKKKGDVHNFGDDPLN